MDVLASRMLLRPADLARSQHFYRHVLGLAVYREFGPAQAPGIVFFLGSGFLEISAGHDRPGPAAGVAIWLQVRDVRAEFDRVVAAGATAVREPRTEFWGLIEAWIQDPDGIAIALVQVPDDHPLRRDVRTEELTTGR